MEAGTTGDISFFHLLEAFLHKSTSELQNGEKKTRKITELNLTNMNAGWKLCTNNTIT